MMILWAVLKSDGSFDGDTCRLKRSPNIDYFNNFTPPPDHMKTLLTIEQYEELKFSWNYEDEIYYKQLNVETKDIEELSEERKSKIKLERHKKYRERITKNGDIEKVHYEDSKSIDWSKAELRTKK